MAAMEGTSPASPVLYERVQSSTLILLLLILITITISSKLTATQPIKTRVATQLPPRRGRLLLLLFCVTEFKVALFFFFY